MKWSAETVQIALQLKLACGSHGYQAILDAGLLYPSDQTLARRMSNIKFQSGILDVFDMMKIKVRKFPCCNLLGSCAYV
jgi:hypothetical protein